MKTKIVFLFIIASLFSVANRSSNFYSIKLSEEDKINKLIEYIRNLKGATFIRNGTEHTAVEAAEHMAMKRKKAGKRVTTAVQFIVYCANKSSVSGKEYMVKLSDGKTCKCIDLLVAELKRIEAADKK